MSLFTLLTFIWSLVCTSCSMHVCKTMCNDGGCEFTEKGNVAKGCFCPISVRSNAVNTCESYRNACTNEIVKYPSCKNVEKCVSVLGFPYCDCPTNDSETECDSIDNKLNTTYPKNPSLYYQAKVKPGEILETYLVIEPVDSNSYSVQFINNAKGTFTQINEKLTKKIDEFYEDCKKKLNEEMCNYAKTTYGDNSKIESFSVIPYFMSKTRSQRTDVHYNGNKSEGRIGGLYAIQLKIVDEESDKILFSFEYFHLVVDDESSRCLPFVDPGQNCETRLNSLKVKRNEDMPVLKMNITRDTEMCEELPEYNYEWKLLSADDGANYGIDPVDHSSKKHVKLNERTTSNPDLFIPKYTLPEGVWIVHFKITFKNQKNGNSKQYSSAANRYMCFLEVNLDGLIAEIVGSPLMQVIESELVTIDASLSYNPNEPKTNQKCVYYIWYCDVKTDVENCKESITTDPVRKLPAPLNKAEKYVFNLTTRVCDEYVERIGKPADGTTKITLLPTSFLYNILIKCIKNCGNISSPLEIVYLSVETNCDNCTFKWFYKEASDTEFTSTVNITEIDVPSHVFIATKHSLDYNKVYTFKVKDKYTELSSYIAIRTAAKPLAGECHVSPTSGIAGKTLFAITCSQFRDDYGDDDLVYYYYERYENGRDEYSILIDRGSNKLSDVKLSTSRKLNVIAFNALGIPASVNISIQVNENRIFNRSDGELQKMFKIMKNELYNDRTSGTVQMSSIISDILLSNKIPDGFSVLIDTISKIPSKGSIFCIEQNVLALKKIVHVCSHVNDRKIKPDDALAISTNLLLIVGNLFEHLLTVPNKEIVSDVERIEQIYNDVKIVIDVLTRDIDPIIYKNNSVDSNMRYFWSSLQKKALVTQNIDKTLKIFAESVLLHQIVYEKMKTYQSKESHFRANMLSTDDMLKGQNNDIIGYDLANELLRSNKNGTFSLKIFEMDRNLAIWTEPKKNPRKIQSNVKYVALSVHNRTLNKYLGLIDKFVLPASITFDVETEIVDKCDGEEYTIFVPAVGSKEIEFDKAIRVFRLDMKEVGAIFITVKSPSHSLLVSWTRNRRPDSELMSDEQYVTKIPSGIEEYKVAFRTHKDYQDEIHYIGIFADTTASNSNHLSNQSYEVKFKMIMVGTRCVHWKKAGWSSEGMDIGLNSSTHGNTVQCFTQHLSLFSSMIFVLPNLPDPVDDIRLFSDIADNMVCLVLVMVIFIVFIITLYWAYVQDNKDVLKSRVTILADNYVGEDEVYLVTVYTGHGFRSGTTANVCVKLNGSIRNSRAHWLHSPYYRTLQRANDDWFLIFTPQSLGELISVHIWHDNYGPDPDWYCQQIIVTEIRANKMWVFEVERWFSVRRSAECIEHVVSIEALEYDWRRVAKEYSCVGIREKHLWASVFICHPRSPITRCQRLGVILCAILSLMLASLMFYELRHSNLTKKNLKNMS